MNTTEQLIDLVNENPLTTVSMAAQILGVTRQRISQIAKKNQLVLRDGRMDKPTDKIREWANFFGGNDRLPTHFIGGSSELIAAAHLLRKGIPVFRSLTYTASFDLVAYIDGSLVRIEVKSARLQKNGRLSFPPAKQDMYDVLALVDQKGNVIYRPKKGVHWPE